MILAGCAPLRQWRVPADPPDADTGTETTTPIAPARLQREAVVHWEGADGEQLGDSIAPASDLDRDDVLDVLVTAPGTQRASPSWHLFEVPDRGAVDQLDVADASVTLTDPGEAGPRCRPLRDAADDQGPAWSIREAGEVLDAPTIAVQGQHTADGASWNEWALGGLDEALDQRWSSLEDLPLHLRMPPRFVQPGPTSQVGHPVCNDLAHRDLDQDGVELGSSHALKVLTDHRAEVDRRLRLEGQLQSSVSHPNIVRVSRWRGTRG